MPKTNFEKCNTHIFVFCSLVCEGEEENAGKYLEKENIWSAEEKRKGEGKGGKYSREGKSDDGQIYKCTTDFPLVDSTSSPEVVEPICGRGE